MTMMNEQGLHAEDACRNQIHSSIFCQSLIMIWIMYTWTNKQSVRHVMVLASVASPSSTSGGDLHIYHHQEYCWRRRNKYVTHAEWYEYAIAMNDKNNTYIGWCILLLNPCWGKWDASLLSWYVSISSAILFALSICTFFLITLAVRMDLYWTFFWYGIEPLQGQMPYDGVLRRWWRAFVAFFDLKNYPGCLALVDDNDHKSNRQ